jgi:hypothetical protein
VHLKLLGRKRSGALLGTCRPTESVLLERTMADLEVATDVGESLLSSGFMLGFLGKGGHAGSGPFNIEGVLSFPEI